MSNLLILGAGGHGKVVADAAFEMSSWQEIAFLDDQYPEYKINSRFPLIGKISDALQFCEDFSDVIVAVGDNNKRRELLEWVLEMDFSVASVIHPSACVSQSAMVAEGVVVFANSVINADSHIGKGCIINTAAVIEHDCVLGVCVHVSPNAVLAGGVTVDEESWIGIGSSIIENVTIGSGAVIGAGSVVLEDVEDKATVVGVPAKAIKNAKN